MFRFLAPHNYHQYADMVITGVVKDNPPFFKGNQQGCYAFYGPSVRATLDHVEANLPAAQYRSSVSRGDGYNSSFYSFMTWEEMMDTYRFHTDRLIPKDLKDDRIEIPQMSGRDVFYDLTGDYVDVGRFMQGEPEHFGNMTMGNPMGVHADIMINLSVVCFQKNDLLNYRCTRIVRLCDWLESQQIRCKIAVFEVNSCVHAEVQVKSLGESLDMAALSVATHGDFFRRVFFRLAEQSATLTSGYGMPASVKNGNLAKLNFDDSNGIVIVSELGNGDSIESIKEGFDKLEEQIALHLSEGERRQTYYV